MFRWLRRRDSRLTLGQGSTLIIDLSARRYATATPSFILEIDGTVSAADVEEIRRSLVVSARPRDPRNTQLGATRRKA